MFGLLDRGFRSSTPRTTRRSAVRRRQRTNLLLERLEDRTVLSSLIFTAGNPSTDFNAAKVEFDQSGTALTVTLTNTSTHVFNSTHALTPTNVLTGVLFDLPASPTTIGNANLASGSRMVNPISSTDTSAKGGHSERQAAAPSTANTTASKLSGVLRQAIPILPTVPSQH